MRDIRIIHNTRMTTSKFQAQRSTGQSDVQLISDIVNRYTSQAGGWSFSYVDADTVRLSKSAGTYSGSLGIYINLSPD